MHLSNVLFLILSAPDELPVLHRTIPFPLLRERSPQQREKSDATLSVSACESVMSGIRMLTVDVEADVMRIE